MKQSERRDLLLLSKNEALLLSLFNADSKHTPVTLSKICSIPRPTIYLVLERLKKRGLIYSIKHSGRKYWHKTSLSILDEQLSIVKNKVAKKNFNYQRLKISKGTDLTIYRGRETIHDLFKSLIDNHNGNRMLGIFGDLSANAWDETFSPEDINSINQRIIQKDMITEVITSKMHLQKEIELFGQGWVDNFVGRAAQTHFLDSKYLDYESQLFIFGHKVYLVSMSESLFIEIKNKQIAKLLISLIKFVEEHTPTVDINKLLREMINKKTPLV